MSEQAATSAITLERYEILEPIGEGKVGTLYRAFDKERKEEIALKVVYSKLVKERADWERFKREISSLAKLHHPSIVRLFGADREGKHAFFTMELVEGTPLTDFVDKKKLPPRKVVEITAQLAEALATAHELDIIHRGVELKNIVLTKEGVPKLLDFSLAKSIGEAPSAQVTKAGEMVGSLAYTPPEVLNDGQHSPAGDVYQLAVSMYQLLAQSKVPLTGPIKKGADGLEIAVSPPSHKNPDVDQTLDELVFAAMAPKTEERIQSAREFSERCQKWLSGETEDRPLGSQQRYEDLRLIGKGDFSKVYRAFDRKLEKEVAVKIIDTTLVEDKAAFERLKREIKALTKMKHPSTIELYDLVIHKNLAYLTMEFIEGEALSDYISKKEMPVREAVTLFAELAEGLAAAHEIGLVHRDVRPDNIQLVDGRLKLLDFSLSKRVDESRGAVVTKKGEVVGSLAYIPPEVLLEQKHTALGDIFQLSASLYQVLTGVKLPATGPTMRTKDGFKLTVDYPSSCNSAVDDELEQIVIDGMAPLPEDRIPTAAYFAARCQQWLENTKDQPASAKSRTRKKSTKKSKSVKARDGGKHLASVTATDPGMMQWAPYLLIIVIGLVIAIYIALTM